MSAAWLLLVPAMAILALIECTYMWLESRKPPSEHDRWCSRVDQDLDA
jgi:hypothetical protein